MHTVLLFFGSRFVMSLPVTWCWTMWISLYHLNIKDEGRSGPQEVSGPASTGAALGSDQVAQGLS